MIKRNGRKVMQKVRITAVRRSFYADLSEKYENFLPDACNVTVGRLSFPRTPKNPKVFATAHGKPCFRL